MLSPDQTAAVASIFEHIKHGTGRDPYFVLEGHAGTGKTFCMSTVAAEYKQRIVFTAPTNKAVKVLRSTLTTAQYKPECCTIHSLLKLQMQANGEVKELKQSDEGFDLKEYSVVVIDEASMLGLTLMDYIARAAEDFPHIRWVFLGDRYQLPPVKEKESHVWTFPQRAVLTKIMRQDNQILQMGEHLRAKVVAPYSSTQMKDANDGEEGVWLFQAAPFAAQITAHSADFLSGKSRAVAWRNATVDALNKTIRAKLFSQPEAYPWQPTDRVTVLEPVQAPDNTKGAPRRMLATTDEEGIVQKAELLEHHPDYPGFAVWRVQVIMESNTPVTFLVLAEQHKARHAAEVARLATVAKSNPREWKAFWVFKEAFHALRHSYATTAHRSQGSTYENAFVNWRDILINPNRVEAYQCLYVAATRPKKKLILG